MGIVMEPEPTVLATELPDTMPSSADATTATLAGPPEAEPATELARSMKKFAMPVRLKEGAEDCEDDDELGADVDRRGEDALRGVEEAVDDGVEALGRWQRCI